MSVETDIISTLDNYSGLTTLTSTRIYTEIPQNPIYPYLYLQFEGRPQNHLNGESSLKNVEVQIDCYSSNPSGIENSSNVMIQVKAAMAASSTFKSICTFSEYYIKEYDPDRFRVILRFSVWQ